MPTIRKRGNMHHVQVRLKEHGVIVFQETASFPSRTQAKNWGVALEAKVRAEGAGARVSSVVTVGALLDKYGAAMARVKPMSRGFEHSLNAMWASPLGKLSLRQLTADKIVEWAITRHEAGNAPATVMHHLATLSAATRAAPALLGIQADPEPVAQAIKQLKLMRVVAPSQRRQRRISNAEIDAICAHMDAREHALIPASVYVRLAVVLPRRRSDLTTMLWPDVTATTVTLRDTKNPRKQRDEVIPLPPAAKAILDGLPRLDARVLPYKAESISAAFQRAVRALGLEDIRLHDLRHEGVSRLFEQGLSIEEVSLVSGHLSWEQLRRYTHLQPSQVTEKLSARIPKA